MDEEGTELSTASRDLKSIDEIKYELALAYRIMASRALWTHSDMSARGIRKGRIATSCLGLAPELVEPDDLVRATSILFL